MGTVHIPRYGLHMRKKGYVAVPAEDGVYAHAFGGEGWKVRGIHAVCDEPVLLLVLDLSDPRLGPLHICGVSELPVCSYVNSIAWAGRQVYRIDAENKEVAFIEAPAGMPPNRNDSFPNPLPRKRLALRDLPDEEICTDEDAYWRACDEFLGGASVIRLLAEPVWLQYVEEEHCACGGKTEAFCSVGYENYTGRLFLDDRPFFMGEGALYFFLCPLCMEVHVVWQSS